MMVEENKKETQDFQEQFKLTTFRHLPESDTDSRQAMKFKNEWLIKLVKRQGEEGKERVIGSPVESLFC